jgi:hypothetical protein
MRPPFLALIAGSGAENRSHFWWGYPCVTPPKNICTCEGAASIGYDDFKFTYSLDNRCRGIYLPIEFAIKVRKLQSTLSSALIRSRSREWASALATVSIKATNPPASWISFEPRTSTARLQRLYMTCKAWQRCWDSLQLGDYGNSSNLCTASPLPVLLFLLLLPILLLAPFACHVA